MTHPRRHLIGLLLAMPMAACPSIGLAQPSGPYPARPVTVLVPNPAGGAPDVLARIVAERLGARTGQAFVVENRPGSSGNLATAALAKARPDGYTLGLLSTAEVSINPHLYRAQPVRAERDLEPVAALAVAPTVLAVHAGLPIQSLPELIAAARARPAELNYGSSGLGSIHHLTAASLAQQVGIEATHIPYKGASQTVPALVAGDIQFAFVGLPAVRTLAAQGRVRLLGVSASKRLRAAPELATLGELGVPGFDVSTRFGLFLPTGTPAAVQASLAEHLQAVMGDPEVERRLVELGMEVDAEAAEPYRARLAGDFERYGRAVRSLGLKID